MSRQYLAQASNPRLVHGSRHRRSRSHLFVTVHLLTKWLNGYVGPLGSETTVLGNACITLFRSCMRMIVVSVLASHFVEI